MNLIYTLYTYKIHTSRFHDQETQENPSVMASCLKCFENLLRIISLKCVSVCGLSLGLFVCACVPLCVCVFVRACAFLCLPRTQIDFRAWPEAKLAVKVRSSSAKPETQSLSQDISEVSGLHSYCDSLEKCPSYELPFKV